jgi:hypothetical protein
VRRVAYADEEDEDVEKGDDSGSARRERDVARETGSSSSSPGGSHSHDGRSRDSAPEPTAKDAKKMMQKKSLRVSGIRWKTVKDRVEAAAVPAARLAKQSEYSWWKASSSGSHAGPEGPVSPAENVQRTRRRGRPALSWARSADGKMKGRGMGVMRRW